jgi:hypothetical protein
MKKEKIMEATPKTDINSAPLLTSSGLSSTSNGLLEDICETMFAVAVATAVFAGLANLSIQINEARAARATDITSGQREVDLGARLSSGLTQVASQSASRSDGAASWQRPNRT